MSETSGPVPSNQPARSVPEAIETRVSMRAFEPTPVPRETLEAIFALSGGAKSVER